VDGGVLAGRFLEREKVCAFIRASAAMEETSAVDVSGQHFGPPVKFTLRRN
jgi:hypothetical protein